MTTLWADFRLEQIVGPERSREGYIYGQNLSNVILPLCPVEFYHLQKFNIVFETQGQDCENRSTGQADGRM